MSGTVIGGLKTAQKIKAYDPEHYKKIGSIGGQVKSPLKGFGTDDRTFIEKLYKPKRAARAGKLGGRISKRGKA